MTGPLVRHPLRLTPLSPIHVGSGEDLDWTRAAPDPARPELLLFDPLSVALPDSILRNLETAAGRPGAGAIIELQKILKTNFQHLRSGETARVNLTHSEHRRVLGSFGTNVQARQRGAGQVANQIAIARHALTPEGRPYVPGSSLKGALRTAIVSSKDCQPAGDGPRRPDSERNGKPSWDDPSDRLLGRFSASPFARLFVSDLLPMHALRGLIAEVRNERRRPVEGREAKGVPLRVEMIPPFVPGALMGDVREHLERGPGDEGRQFLALAELMKTVHAFHLRLFDFFAGELQRADRCLPADWRRTVGKMLAEEPLATAIREGRAALVRLGKFCSAESKTVEWRAVRIPQAARKGGQEFVLHPYTLWLADLGPHRLPLGWALLELAEEPSDPVRAFCAKFAGADRTPSETDEDEVTPKHSEPPLPPPAPRLVTDRSGPNLSRLGALEDQHDAGKPIFDMLKNLSQQAQRWTAEERRVLARLYHGKLRETLKPHQHSVIDPRLPKPE